MINLLKVMGLSWAKAHDRINSVTTDLSRWLLNKRRNGFSPIIYNGYNQLG
jgi:hypothetical protein